MASYFDAIAENKVKSILLMAIFSALFLAILYVFVWLLGGGLIAMILGLIVILIYGAIVYFTGDKIVLKMSKAVPADQKQYPRLYSIVDGLSTAAQIPMPKIYIINDPNPNAFATGKNKKASSIAVTSGLLNMMNETELQGVIAHEMSHVYNNDIQFMMIAVVFAGAIGVFAIFARSFLFFGGNGRNGGILILVALVIGILAPIFAALIRLAISRKREYMADANGARLIRDPGALASALQKIQAYEKAPKATPVKSANEMTASMYFANPFTSKSILNIFSTHPPIEDRIKRLKEMY